MGEFCPLVELHREGSAPAACAAGLLTDPVYPGLFYKSNSQILVTWNFKTNQDTVPWIWEKLHIGAEFQQFSRNNMHIRMPGKLSEICSKVLVFSNTGDNIQFLVKLRDRLVPFVFTHFRTLSLGLENIGNLECISDSFPGTLRYMWFLENSWNSAPMCSSSPIQGTMSWLVLKFHVAKIWESNINSLVIN